MSVILVVDDMRTDRDLIGSVVESVGHTAEYACDGEEAIQKARSIKPSLILMDVVMPKQDGFATCRKLKKEGETSQIPVVLITSKGNDSDKYWGQRQGADAYLVKPFVPKDLARMIQKYL